VLSFRTGFVLINVAPFVLTACATQNINQSSGSTPETQATIFAQSKAWSYALVPGNFIGVTIESVDGLKIKSGTYKVSVDPGIHKVSVTCRAMGLFNTQELDVDAAAGARYEVVAAVGGPEHCISVVEQKMKK
jgi:hypothetical protein